jgi:hypothetical protein
VPARGILYALMVAVAVPGFGVAADSSPAKIVEDIGQEIEKLKAAFPQLAEFSRHNVNADRLTISYSYHTHEPERTGGWTSGVPHPDADGIWFHIDLHDAASTAQIHTQPMTASLCLGDLKVSFLMLEGTETKPVYAAIWKILASQGVEECNRAERAADDRIPPLSLVADIRLGVYPGWSLSISPDGSAVIGYGSSAFDFVSVPTGTFNFGQIYESLATQVRPYLGNMRESFTVVFRQRDATISDALYIDNADLVLDLFKTAKQNCVLPGRARIDELWERQPPSLEQSD